MGCPSECPSRVNATLRPDTRQLLLWIEQRQSSPARNWLSHPWESDTLRRLAVLAGGGVVETGARTGHPADAFCSVNAGIGFRLTCAVARRADAQRRPDRRARRGRGTTRNALYETLHDGGASWARGSRRTDSSSPRRTPVSRPERVRADPHARVCAPPPRARPQPRPQPIRRGSASFRGGAAPRPGHRAPAAAASARGTAS